MNGIRASAKIRKRRRKPGELSTPMAAIKCHCLECVGYQTGEVSKCTSPDCHLSPYRFKSKKKAHAVILAEIRGVGPAFPDETDD